MKSSFSRLQFAISKLEVTPYEFSRKIGYKRPDLVYQVLNNKKNISDNMIKRISDSEFNINIDWLKTGKGTPFVKKLLKGSYGNEYSANGEIVYPARLRFREVRQIALGFANIIGELENRGNYEVKARPSIQEGIEFIFTTYGIEENKRYNDDQYVLIMSPEWKVELFFDFWRVDSPNRRCQNLYSLMEEKKTKYQSRFENVVCDIIESIDKSYFEYHERGIFFNSLNKDEDGFAILYNTDLRFSKSNI